MFFDIGFHTFLFEVIAAIGFGFIILSLVLKLSFKQIGTIGLVIVFGHNLLSLYPFAETSLFKTILMPFFGLGTFPLFSGKILVIGYPPIPWLGIMLIGFASGHLFEREVSKRESLFVKIGITSLLLFCILRILNVYGDPQFWSSQKSSILTFLSFLNVTKYPPSLLFCLVTLGIMFLLLASADHYNNRLRNIAAIYGKIPLFYFITHFYLIHFITLTVLFIQGFHWSQLEFTLGTFGRPKVGVSGLELWAIYLIWNGVVLILYKPCLWFWKYKAEHKKRWLRYI